MGFARTNINNFKEYLTDVIDELYKPKFKVTNITKVEVCTCPVCGLNHKLDEIKKKGQCYGCLTKLEV